MGFYKNAVIDMRHRNMTVSMDGIPRLTAHRAAVMRPATLPVTRIAIMATSTNDPKDRPNQGNTGKEDRANARGSVDEVVKGLHREAQNPDDQPSSRGGGGLSPSDAPVVLLHRRGRAASNMLQDFDSEDLARAYCRKHKLMIVHAQRDGDQLKLYYLPE